MDELRKPFFIVALILMALAFGVELGSNFVPGGQAVGQAALKAAAQAELGRELSSDEIEVLNRPQKDSDRPPGIGISYTALLDVLLAYSVIVLAAALLLADRVTGKLIGVATLIVSLLTLIAAFILIFVALEKLLIMLGMFLAAPFGTIAYLALWGFFPKGKAAAILGSAMALKIAFLVCLVLAQQRFLKNKSLVFMILTSLLATFLISFLHGLVPSILVSIVDALGAIIVAVLALIWALILLIRSIPSIIRVLRVDRALA